MIRQDKNSTGVTELLKGHLDKVNALKFLPTLAQSCCYLLSGSVDKSIKVWKSRYSSYNDFECVATLQGHRSSVNCIAVCPGSNFFATGSADASVKIWGFDEPNHNHIFRLIQNVVVTPRFFPLTLALSEVGEQGDHVLAVAGTKSNIQVYVRGSDRMEDGFHIAASLPGHEGWIHSLAFTQESQSSKCDLLLASASQDKYIRLWRVRRDKNELISKDSINPMSLSASLSNKTHRLSSAKASYSLTFEALLLGHEDWIYGISWRPDSENPQLLSASADNSLAIWEPESSSGVWVCTARLGESSAQKGSTTATGSTGGFWIGLWSPDGQTVVSLGRTGSWRLWNYAIDEKRWTQGQGIGGHVESTMSVAWANNGSYMLSTGSDQTTRLHAEWKRESQRSWHEFARPQIHGYDLNCIDSLGKSRFVSGADEKLLRVFDEPRATAELLDKLCGISIDSDLQLPEAANVPMLGLSNKAIGGIDGNVPAVDNEQQAGEVVGIDSPNPTHRLVNDHPPREDQLARQTLWPEREKLYGHGYEISTVAASHDGTLVATACKASSIDHAVIRLYETTDWREIKPPLSGHSLTVTSLSFSDDDLFLLSVGRDRQWVVFERDILKTESYTSKTSNSKAHSRMILDATWAPSSAGRIFATAGRDKTVKVWEMQGESITCKATISLLSPVTAVDFFPRVINSNLLLAMGEDSGDIVVYLLSLPTLSVVKDNKLNQRCALGLDTYKPWTVADVIRLCPSKSVTRISWRPPEKDLPKDGDIKIELAATSEDSSLRLFAIAHLFE